MFQGRYGNDQLNRALLFTGLGLIVINLFIPYTSYWRNICTIAYVGVSALALMRMFSRNIQRRTHENVVFMNIYFKLKGLFDGSTRAKIVRDTPTFEERRKYKYFFCNQCAQRLRVPRKKGKIRVTCTRCGNKFEMKS